MAIVCFLKVPIKKIIACVRNSFFYQEKGCFQLNRKQPLQYYISISGLVFRVGKAH